MTVNQDKSLIFISYSRTDRKWVDRLRKFLKPKMRNNTAYLWDDSQIKPGTKWKAEIEKAIERAKIAILMVSIDFLASDFINDQELFPILEKAEAQGLTILWIPVEESLYQATPIASYQAAWNPDNPLMSIPPSELGKAWLAIGEHIEEALSTPKSDATDELSSLSPIVKLSLEKLLTVISESGVDSSTAMSLVSILAQSVEITLPLLSKTDCPPEEGLKIAELVLNKVAIDGDAAKLEAILKKVTDIRFKIIGLAALNRSGSMDASQLIYYMQDSQLNHTAMDLVVMRGDLAVDHLKPLWQKENRHLMTQGIDLITHIGGKEAVFQALALLESPKYDSQLHELLASALEKMGELAVAPLIKNLYRPKVGTRVWAAKILGRIGSDRAIEPLKKRLSDKNDEVQKSAKCALEKIFPGIMTSTARGKKPL